MKKILLGIAGVIAFAAPASAADLAARPYTKAPAMIAAVYDWSGFYIGANGGWGSSHKCWDFVNAAGVFIAREGCHDATGGTAGGQIGYRWQAGSWVFGLEGQGNWADFTGRSISLVDPTLTGESSIRAFGLLTGQIGYAWNNVLLYVKGGAAVTDDRFRVFNTGTNVLAANAVSDTRWGGTIGAGLEFGFSPNWSAGVEYNHLFMGDRTVAFTSFAPAVVVHERISQDADIVTVRLNYRWGGPVVAKY
ncbi:MAG TPA: outer membrane beta-barrel protein [Bradyrhizobium sp.]|nr:outer membrane beta-barrel protein [Bradyrhizobium sp.]